MDVSEKLVRALFQAGLYGKEGKFFDISVLLVTVIGECGHQLQDIERDSAAIDALRLTNASPDAGPMTLMREDGEWITRSSSGIVMYKALDPADAILGKPTK